MTRYLPMIQRSACLQVFLCMIFNMAHAQVRLPRLVGDSMILQRDTKTRIWGWASPGEKITVRISSQSFTALADTAGKWSVQLAPMSAGGPYDMSIDASNHLLIKAILIGDVWVCSGQSNMELPMERVKEKYPDVIAQSANPAIRQFNVATRYDFSTPQDDLASGSWQMATPANVLSFSATGYFFARELYEKYHVPIGLIKAAVGGAPAEAWLSEKTLQHYPDYAAVAAVYKRTSYRDSIRHREDSMTHTWYEHIAQQDTGLHDSRPWFDPAYDDAAWHQMNIPGFWADQGLPPVNGVVWFRKDIDIPQQLTGHAVKLMLGRIVDQDSVYVNGVFVGTIGYQYPPRRYEIPAGVLHPGKNILVVRVISNSGKGGFIDDKPYWLGLGDTRIDLRGKWRYRLGATSAPLAPTTFFQYRPLGLFNGIISPLLPFTIKGVIWYQGEANTFSAWEYRRLFSDMIADWRKNWGEGNFPFLYVQLPNFMEEKAQPSESSWAALREAQLQTLAMPNTGMAVAIDLGEWNDIHPLNKEDVGRRLALTARTVAYGEKGLVASGPIYQSMHSEGNAIRLSFTSTGSGLTAKGGGPLKGFAIAGPDKHFIWAEARIEGGDVVVKNNLIKNPIAVRYAWADNPAGANLYNKEGLPASPFRTDTTGPIAPPIHLTAEEDHHRMMQLLHIDTIRRGRDGNPHSPYAANYDETKANPYPDLPDPLQLKNGKKVTTAAQWWHQRRPEIVEDFDKEIYGRIPKNIPKVNWEVVSTTHDNIGTTPVITKKLIGHVDNSSYPAITVNIDLTLTIPANARGPVPVMMELSWIWPANMRRPDPPPGPQPVSWQEQVLAKGWGIASVYPTSIQPDNGAGLEEGIIGLVNKGQPRQLDDWGALRAWAWGASRALDYFETDPAVDARQVGLEGHSRYGKATAVAMADDPRFAIAFISSSGEGGAKLHRRDAGEIVENIAGSGEYHWMAGNFIKYAGPLHWSDLPIDAHELLALCAPRPIFISAGAKGDEWTDQRGMFMAAVAAGPVYRLLGKKDLGTVTFPPLETSLIDGDIAWRQHSGGHTPAPNWATFLEFASRYIKIKQP